MYTLIFFYTSFSLSLTRYTDNTLSCSIVAVNASHSCPHCRHHSPVVQQQQTALVCYVNFTQQIPVDTGESVGILQLNT